MLCRSRLQAAKALREVRERLEAVQAQLAQAQQAVAGKDQELRHAMADVQKSAAKRDHLK